VSKSQKTSTKTSACSTKGRELSSPDDRASTSWASRSTLSWTQSASRSDEEANSNFEKVVPIGSPLVGRMLSTEESQLERGHATYEF